MFTIGGLTGIVLANAGVDVALHDKSYITAIMIRFNTGALKTALLFFNSVLDFPSPPFGGGQGGHTLMTKDYCAKPKGSATEAQNLKGSADLSYYKRTKYFWFRKTKPPFGGWKYGTNVAYFQRFWVGLMDGDGSIIVNHWRKCILQYRFVIKLKNTPANVYMLQTLSKKLSIGHVVIDSKKQFVLWVENHKGKMGKLL